MGLERITITEGQEEEQRTYIWGEIQEVRQRPPRLGTTLPTTMPGWRRQLGDPWARWLLEQWIPEPIPFDEEIFTIYLYTFCKRRPGSSLVNPYANERNGFHITFYEGVPSAYQNDYGLWKTGTLYKKPNTSDEGVQYFRQSAFSVLATRPHDHWKIWLLGHSDLKLGKFKSPQLQVAELQCIVWALAHVGDRWEGLHGHIAGLLSDDFMDSENYVKLLSDDAAFRRSKLYFWVIGCLNEFDISITDNINQWDLFKKARYKRLSDPAFGGIPEHQDLQDLQDLLQQADEFRGSLDNLRSQFRNQLETAKALRDGLFNASALLESRTSTRLAQNVKLLTYVSLFYLPLAFCAALWAIPNITDESTRNPFIISAVIVGFITYTIVFNLENIAGLCSGVYRGHRTRLVNGMQKNSKWRVRGEGLEVFQPNDGHKTTSEWWILVYQVLTWAGQVKEDEGRGD